MLEILSSCRVAVAVAIGMALAGENGSLLGQSRPQVTEDAQVNGPVADGNGTLHFEVHSPLQAGRTKVSVLLPKTVRPAMPVVYFLPVEPGEEKRYGNGLEQARKGDLHNRFGAVIVAPTFFHLPWYADHPKDASLQQETYFVRVVLPLIESRFDVGREKQSRRLLGFSKSGWGAWTLLLRQPDLFGHAVAWDAPLMMSESGKYGSGPIFGSQEQFRGYQISELLATFAANKEETPRLALLGYGNFREHHQKVHKLLESLEIPHVYRDGPARKHHWNSGWVPEAMDVLMKE